MYCWACLRIAGKTEREAATEQEQDGEREAEQAAWERQLQVEKMRLAHELKLKQIEVKSDSSADSCPDSYGRRLA